MRNPTAIGPALNALQSLLEQRQTLSAAAAVTLTNETKRATVKPATPPATQAPPVKVLPGRVGEQVTKLA